MLTLPTTTTTTTTMSPSTPSTPGAAWPALVACDGGVIGQAPRTLAGTWAACWVGADNTLIWADSGIVPATEVSTPVVTSQQSEFYALIRLLESLSPAWWGWLVMDSAVTAGRAFSGYGLKNIPAAWALRLMRARDRLDLRRLHLHMVKGHPTPDQLTADQTLLWAQQRYNEWNVHCDSLCRTAAQRWRAEHGQSSPGDSTHG